MGGLGRERVQRSFSEGGGIRIRSIPLQGAGVECGADRGGGGGARAPEGELDGDQGDAVDEEGG